jgi:hypothetical protein
MWTIYPRTECGRNDREVGDMTFLILVIDHTNNENENTYT